MPYRVELLPKALEDLRRLDRATAQRMMRRLRWLSENMDAVAAETLAGELRGFHKLRVGSYRVLYTVTHAHRLVIVHELGHRKDIYRRR